MRLQLGVADGRRIFATLALFGAYPFLRVAAANPRIDLPMSRLLTYWAGFVALGLVAALVLLLAFPGHFDRITTTVALSMFATGFLAVELEKVLDLGAVAGVRASLLITLGVAGLAIWLGGRPWSQLFVLLFGVLLCVATVAQIVDAKTGIRAWPLPEMPEGLLTEAQPANTPNIFWIVLDGMARGDVLADTYNLDGVERFESELSTYGFTVSSQTVAAYPITLLSMSSTLSADYLASTGEDVGNSLHFQPVITGESRVVATLRAWGYRYLHWEMDWITGMCSGAEDVCVKPNTFAIGELEWILWSRTPFAGDTAPISVARGNALRTEPLTAVESVLAVKPEAPFFAQIHLMNPHPPHLFSGEDCAIQSVPLVYSLPYGTEEYRESVICLWGQTIDAVDLIVRTDPTAVVLIQGDHGPADFVVGEAALDEWTPEQVRTRLATFSAMRLTEGCAVPDALNLVNTFRIVIGCLAEEPVPLLHSRTFLANQNPGEVLEIRLP